MASSASASAPARQFNQSNKPDASRDQRTTSRSSDQGGSSNASGSSRQSRDQALQLCPNNWKISGCTAGACRKKHDNCSNGDGCQRIFYHKSKDGQSGHYVLCLYKHPTSTHQWMLDNGILKSDDSVALMDVAQVMAIIAKAKSYQQVVILDRVEKTKEAGIYANQKALTAQKEITDERIAAITFVKKAEITAEKKASLYLEYKKALIELLMECDYKVEHSDYKELAPALQSDYHQEKPYAFTPEEINELKARDRNVKLNESDLEKNTLEKGKRNEDVD